MKESESSGKYRTRIVVGMRMGIGIEIHVMEERDTLHTVPYSTLSLTCMIG